MPGAAGEEEAGGELFPLLVPPPYRAVRVASSSLRRLTTSCSRRWICLSLADWAAISAISSGSEPARSTARLVMAGAGAEDGPGIETW